MRLLRSFAVLIAMMAAPAFAADELTVFGAQLTGPAGISSGKLVVFSDRLVFIDDERPNVSVVVGKPDVRRLAVDQGVLMIDLARPVSDRFGSRTNLILKPAEPQNADLLVRWAGVQPAGGVVVRTDEPAAVVASQGAGAIAVTRGGFETVSLDVRHDHAVGNCSGRLILREDSMSYESVGESDHSRTWKYTEIDELERNRSENKVVIEPENGGHFTLKLTGAMDEGLFQEVSDRIVAARQQFRR